MPNAHQDNTTRLPIIAGFVLALFAGVTSASAFESPQDGVYKDRIDWGATSDLSGPAAATQKLWMNGLQSFIKSFNDAGGAHGRKINLLAEDSRYDAANERIIYEKFVSQTPVLATSGMGNSSAQVALLPLIKRAKLPVVGTYASAKPMIDPPNPYFYGAFCGFKEMAQVGTGYFIDKLKLKAPKVAVVHLDVASGKDYFSNVEPIVTAAGGVAKSIPIKVVAADATAQVLEIVNMKPDFITIHGVATTSLLVMKGLAQYGIDTPTFAIAYLGTPGIYESLGPQAGKPYSFVSCLTPASVDPAAATQMVAAATKDGHAAAVDDINFVNGWVIGQLIGEAVKKVGPEPTREKLVEMLNKDFTVDTGGLSSPLRYTPTDHAGLTILKPMSYDYQTKKFVGVGDYKDYEKYLK